MDRITLTRAIKDLPAGYRTIFLLHEVEGYEHQEIAKILDCSVGNSKSQLHKAKLRIREFLAEPGKDETVEAQQANAQETASPSRQRKTPRSELGFAEAVLSNVGASVPLVQEPTINASSAQPAPAVPTSLCKDARAGRSRPHQS